MKSATTFAATVLAPSLVLGIASPGAAQDPLTTEDYGKWERLAAATLSPNGEWFVYRITRNNEEDELRIVSLTDDATWVIPFGTTPQFSEDGAWLAYRIEPSEDEKAELREANKPVRNALGLFRVAARDTLTVAEVASFAFSDDGGFLAIGKYKSEEAEKDVGSDLVVRDLESGADISFGNVSEFAWSDDGHLLAMILSTSGGAGNGVQLFDPASGVLRPLDSKSVEYSNLSWREDAYDLALLRAEPDTIHEDTAHVVLAWRSLDSATPQALIYDPAEEESFPEGMRIVEYRSVSWSDDGGTVFFGIQQRRPSAEREFSVRDSSTVEVWHSGDVRVIPHQKMTDRRLREENFLTAWHLDSAHLVRLGDELTEEVRLAEGQRFALGLDNTPYEAYGRFFPDPDDLYRIDVATGEKTLLQERVLSFYLSSSGRYVMYLEDEQYWTYEFDTGERVQVSAEVTTPLVNMEDDHPRPERFPYGIAGWTEDDSSVVVYDRFDSWELRSDGSGATRLTGGAEDAVRHRYVRLDPEEEFIDLSSGVYLSVRGIYSKEGGYARLRLGEPPERLVWQDKWVAGLEKAEDAEVYVYLAEGYDDSPDYFVGDASLGDVRQITETNPFQNDYDWGRTELIEFDNPVSDARLQGVLVYPADYRRGRQYPMVVHMYERLSDRLHLYRVPSERSAYNPTVFSSQGYFVLMPDITFEKRDPGFSALWCVETAVKKVLETGMVDPERVGIMGHSWGGYETTFIAAHSDLFAAAVAGAPLTNLVSMYGMIYWNTGIPETGHYEYGQERMEVPLWQDPEAYISNSPVMAFDRMETPLLMAFGDEDGSVDWHQGIEAYNLARRLDKDFVLLVYRGENHSNAQKANQIDYHHRQLEWFNYYLKGEAPPPWITEGVTWVEQKANRASK
ncbi:MAG: prolyl oligopeptidase family serine peptidase [Gemmatimonadota bacterium]|nr:MAG: prolyl oligopeptidase family serine peptidase [Gemmatimonadota bacterium]